MSMAKYESYNITITVLLKSGDSLTIREKA